MEKEELTKLKENINKELEDLKNYRKEVKEGSEYCQFSIAISNLYIALSNLI